ncbi:Na+/H+ antiporter NhaC family protein [Halarchaeum sp. CBA1220]|uniref:Na+/H+ antiporter NhaC family protein n=1 Tax=Halarchaeum sp. CBA1220 TaxID=1853682 RepID=UPI000F3A8E90|nr:Na+/H+ antiporter NhaC family protein [Halarchaeum sp. CBA1220]QLC33859.1 Na+/H+ antiporter NhaC family protein [Halarchaeum sp. CBA1220]
MSESNDSDVSSEVEAELGMADSAGPDLEFHGGAAASAIPLGVFVVWAVVQSGLFGIGDTTGLVVGMLFALVVGLFFAKGDWKHYANTIFEGMTQRVAATAIVAWLWAGMFAQLLQDGGFVRGLIWTAQALPVSQGVLVQILPAVTFLLAALLATGIGTGYGTAVTFVTTFFPATVLLGANPVLMFGAVLSGAAFGDNLAPVSDTTIVSAVTQNADIGGVVASRFKYAITAATLAFAAYLVAGAAMPTTAGSGGLPTGTPVGLVHLVSMGVVIYTAIRGRHIVEAITWGMLVAIACNLLLGLQSLSGIISFVAPQNAPFAGAFTWLPFLSIAGPDTAAGVGGSLYSGAAGFFPLIVLTLLIVAGARIMIQGGAFDAIQEFLLSTVATSVRRAETTLVLGTALVNAAITINTAAEIAISPYVARIGESFNINGYRRANILDANTSALGYIFPWAGGVLAGYSAMPALVDQYGAQMLVSPVRVVPFVFHGWFLFAVFLVAALTGFGLEYVPDRESEEVSRV